MQTVTNQIKQSMAGSSWIRKMFEKGIELKKRYGADRAMPGTLTKLGTVYLSLEGLIDKAAEAKRVAAELEKTRGFIKSIDAKLSNENFVAHAPAAIVEGQKAKRAELVANVAKLEKLAKLFASA